MGDDTIEEPAVVEETTVETVEETTTSTPVEESSESEAEG